MMMCISIHFLPLIIRSFSRHISTLYGLDKLGQICVTIRELDATANSLHPFAIQLAESLMYKA